MMKHEIKKRLKEPSTWAGIATLLVIFTGGHVDPVSVQALSGTIAALVAIFLPEGNAE